jgi:hypothetical protein
LVLAATAANKFWFCDATYFKLIFDQNQCRYLSFRYRCLLLAVEECQLTKDAASSSAAKLNALPLVIRGQERTEAALSLQKDLLAAYEQLACSLTIGSRAVV